MTDPSAALFFNTSITTRPPAPARFSTIVEDAYVFICSARSLAITSLGPPAGKPTMMRAVECNGCDSVGEGPRAYDMTPPALPNKKRRRLGLITRRTSVIATPCIDSKGPESIGKFFGDGLLYIRSLSHARSVLDNARNACRVDAVCFQPLREREQIWVGNRIGVSHHPWTPEHVGRWEEHTSELQSLRHLVCRL